jgi:hypothetical protein
MSKEDDQTHQESHPHHHPLTREPTREEKTREAIAEGHDADIPSNIGFIPTEADEQRRRSSFASHRRASHASKRAASLDPEKQGGDVGDEEEGGSQTQSESDIVWWDGDKDRQNPYNFATWKKVLNCVLVSALTFVTPLASCK